MSVSRRLRRLFRLPFPNTARNERELRDEIGFHVDARTRELMRSGCSAEEARRRAVAGFGDLEFTEDYCRTMNRRRDRRRWRRILFDELFQDLRYAARRMISSPSVSLVTVLTLALGIGANAAIFSIANAALLRRPAVEAPEELATVWTTCRAGNPRCSSSYPDYLDYRDRSETFVDIAAHDQTVASLGSEEGAALVNVHMTSGNYADLLGLTPSAGRLIQVADDTRGAAQAVAVLGHEFWRRHFGGDETIVGATTHLNRTPFTVVGIMDPRFRGLRLGDVPDLYVPLLAMPGLRRGDMSADGIFDTRDSRWISGLVGRLRPDATLAESRQEMLAISAQLAEEDPDARGSRTVTVDPAGNYQVPLEDQGNVVMLVGILLGVVVLILVLACANLANLFLARASARRHEIGVREAIGASRGRLVRQLITESVLYSLVGGVAGLAVAAGGLRVMAGYQLPGGLVLDQIGTELDTRVLAYAAILSVLTGVAFGLVPALQSTRSSVVDALRSGRGVGDSSRARGVLVAIQVGVCVVLLLSSALFLQALRNGLNYDLGFESESLALATFQLDLLRYEPAEAEEFTAQLVGRVRALPGVENATLGSRLPLLPSGTATLLSAVEGYELGPDEELRLEYNYVGSDFFQTLGLPLLAGRSFEPSDNAGTDRVVVINEAMATAWWPGRNAIGGVVRTFDDQAITVIGVVGNTKWDDGIRAGDYPFGYLYLGQRPAVTASVPLTLAVRAERDVVALLPQLRAVIATLDSDVSIRRLTTMRAVTRDTMMPQIMGSTVTGAFALLAVLLAGIGIYGVVAYTVGQRRHEMGVHLALGAQGSDLIGLVVRGMVRSLGAGLAAGLLAAMAFAGRLESFMYEVDPTDPWIILGVVSLLALITFVATLVPARLVTRVDPLTVLKSE